MSEEKKDEKGRRILEGIVTMGRYSEIVKKDRKTVHVWHNDGTLGDMAVVTEDGRQLIDLSKRK